MKEVKNYKSKVVRVHAMNVEWGSKGISPLILNAGTREVSDLHTPATLPAGKDPYSDRIGDCLGVTAGLGDAGEQKTSCLFQDSKSGPSSPSLVAIPTTVYRSPE